AQRVRAHTADATAVRPVEHAHLLEAFSAGTRRRHELDPRAVPEPDEVATHGATSGVGGDPRRLSLLPPATRHGLATGARRCGAREEAQQGPRPARIRIEPHDATGTRGGVRHWSEEDGRGEDHGAGHVLPYHAPGTGHDSRIAVERSGMWLFLMLALLLAPVTRAHGDALLKVGDPFPAWSLPDHAGATVSSADLAGKTYLLWFYPKAMTPGCTVEGRGLRDEVEAFRKQGVE